MTILTTRLGEFYRATGTSPADLAAVIHQGVATRSSTA